MNPAVIPAIGAAVGAIGGGAMGLLGGAHQARGARRTAQRQMDFQERMASTQYQRAMADMEKAGLNPMLAYQQGGAAAPQGAGFMPPNIGEAGLSSAVQAAQAQATIRNLKAVNKLIYEQEQTERSKWYLNHDLGRKAIAEERFLNMSRDHMETQNALLRAQLPYARTIAEYDSSRLGQRTNAWQRFVQGALGRSSAGALLRMRK